MSNHPLTDLVPDYLDALALRQACGEIEERLTRERDEAWDRIYDMCSVLSSGCADSKARSPVEWAEHMLTERDALRAEVERLRGALQRVSGDDFADRDHVINIARAALTPAEEPKT